MKNFWQEQIQKYWKLCLLAPMDWYWDSAYRQTVKKIAPHVICVSEFFSADWLIHSKHLAEQVLPHTKIETPLIMQIFGKDPEIFAKAWKIIEQEKYDMYWIDINMWCPAKKVVRSGHWSSLLINEQTAFNIVQKIDEAVKLPISVKTRLSFDWWQDLIKFWKGLEKAWCKLLTVHGRTAKQAYTWIANWEPIYLLKNELQIPVIWNWDVQNFTDWMKKVKNLDWFMIGRWSFWNPWCFLWKEHLNESEKKFFINWQYHPTLQEILDIMEFHAEKLVETKWEHKWSLEIRKHLVQYLKNFPWVKAYRKKLVTTESIENTQNTLNEIKTEFKDFLDKRPWLGEISKESLGLE
jgi:tRNA-dihydrouridine synthase